MDYSDKVVWITGASSGIGEHLAYAYAELGAKLILTSRNVKELERVRQNCRESGDILVLPADVTNFESLPDKVDRVINHFGYLNILINNAGLGQRSAVRDTKFEVDQEIMEVNFLGTVALTKAVLPKMIEQQFGQIVVISSVLGKLSIPRRSAYAASKHALHGFFDSLRAEVYREQLTVTMVCPGYVNTNLPINALRGDGQPNHRTDSEREGMEPAVFAQKAIRAIEQKKKEVYIGGWREVLAIYFKRLSPTLFFRAARNLKVK